MDLSSELIAVLLAFFRIASFLFFIPMLNSSYIPSVTKVTLSLAIALSVSDQMKEIPIQTAPELVFAVIVQIAIGLTLAYVLQVIFSSARMAGGLLDVDMGFAASQIIDPASGRNTTILSNVLFIIFMMIFIKLGGINSLISGIVYSFKFTTPGFFMSDYHFIETVLSIVLYMFTAAVQIALPLTASMFILNFMMLVVGKSAPQMNIFTNIFAIKIAAGMLILYVSLPFIGEVFMQMNDLLMDKFEESLEAIFRQR